MGTKLKSKKNKIAKELFSSKYKLRIVKAKKEKEVTVEKILKSSTYLLNNFRGHFSSFI